MNGILRMRRRITAMILTLCMMLSSVAGYIPGWFTAFAEESVEETVASHDDSSSESSESSHNSESHGSSETSHSSESSGSSETSHSSEPSGSSETSHSSESSGSSETSQSSESSSSSETTQSSESSSSSESSQSSESNDSTESSQSSESGNSSESGDNAQSHSGDVLPVVTWGGTEDATETPSVSSEPAKEDDNTELSEEAPVVVWPGSTDDTEDASTVSSESAGDADSSETSEEVPVVVWSGATEDTEASSDVPSESAGDADSSDMNEEAPATVLPGSMDDTEASVDVSAEPAAEGEVQESSAEPVIEAAEQADGSENTVESDENAVVDDTEDDTTAVVDAEVQPVENFDATVEETEANKPSETEADQPMATTMTAALELPELSDTKDGANEEEKAPSEPFTLAAYTAPAMLAASEAEPEKKACVLQQKIDDAMSAVTGTLTGRIKVVLEKDTTYDGEVKIEKGERTVADDFELEIASEDAGDDGTQSAGKTTFTGTMSIKGINVAIRGVGLPGKVSVQDAALAYTGSKGDDTVNMEVGEKASAEIQTGEGNDTVNAKADADAKLNIQTGEGGDTVNAAVTQTATADIDTGAGDDKVNLADASIGKVGVDTGDDNDAVEVDVSPANGYSAGEIDIDTGDGDDSVTLLNKDGNNVIDDNRKGIINVDLGTGVNEATVSADVGGIAPTVTIKGEDGNDHVHITGTLDEDKDANKRITGTKENLNIASDKGELKLALQNVESLTDDLKNKRTQTLTADGGKKVSFTYEGAESFTNYELKAPASQIEKIVITGKDGQPLLLSSLVIDTSTTWDGENKLVIPEGATIEARGMTVRLTAKDIEVNGTIKADTVQLEALDGTGMNSRNFGDMYSAFSGAISVPGLAQVGGAVAAGAVMAWDLVNVNDEATITIGKNGAVLASGDVIMLAKVEQSGSLISILPVNLVNVKVVHASVDIAGKVYAGVSNIDSVNSELSNVELDEGKGSVRVNAQIKTSIGEHEDSFFDGILPESWPVAVSVVYANASVNVKEGATIGAAGDIQIGSQSEIKAETRADSGLAGLPAAVAVAVLINDVRTTVNGTLTAKGGDARVTANGQVEAKTSAAKGEGHESVSGGYAAVTVALQDVKTELGKTAVVNAKGEAQVLSNAVEKVENHATSAKQDSGDDEEDLVTKAKAKLMDILVDDVWPKVKESLGEKFFPDSAEEKLDKAMEKVSSGNHSVKLDDEAQAHGDVQTKSETKDGKTNVKVTVTPREGYQVERVVWRGYNAGDDHYTTGTATGSGKEWTFPQSLQNVKIYVEYEEAEAPDEPATPEDQAEMEEFFRQYEQEDSDSEPASDGEIQQLVEEMNNELKEKQKLDKDLRELEDATELVDFTLSGNNGSVLTDETEDDDNINPLSKVYTGQKVELIPNPQKGFKLKEGGLTASYSVTEKVNGKDTVVLKKIVINPDNQGRYWLEVPEKDKLDISQGILVSAAFEAGESEKEADQTQFQMTGTIAVAVVENDNQAIIAEGARVNAGGVEVTANANTDVQNIADGSAVSKDSNEKKKEDEYKIKRLDAKEYSGYDVEGLKFGLLADATRNGSIKVEKTGVNRYEYTIEATPENGYAVGTALLTYYQDGEKKTATLKPDGEGKYHINLAGAGFDVDEGSTAVLSFGFVGNGDDSVTVSEVTTTEPQVIIPNPILLSYNALKDEKYDRISDYAGTVLYNARKNKTDDDGKITAYAFVAEADSDNGYDLDGKLKATWKDASGKEQSKELTEDDGVWYLEMNGIPAGAPVKVTAVFKEDFHDFKVDEKKTTNGKVTLHDDKVKAGDNPKITVTPTAGFSVGDIVVTYKDGSKDKTLKLSDGDLVQVKKDGKVVEGLYELKEGLDELSKGDVTVSASFNRKSIVIYAGEGDKDKDVTLQKNAGKGEKVTVSPNADKVKAGYKVTKITVTDKSGKTVAESSDGSFTIPEKTDENATLTVKAELGLKEIEIKNAELTNGKVTSSVARADRGEKVTVTIKPDDNFRLKSGTLKAVVTEPNGATTEVFTSRQNDTTYTFDLPSNVDKDSKVSFVSEFEPGQSDSSVVDTSLGAGIAVTVSNSETRADVKGRIDSKGNVTTQAEITGGVKTETKAGFSKGNIGMGGAVSVQVASMDAKALIHDSADIAMDGKLIVDSKADINYNVNADASGSKEAAKTGVGAGIAVAVNGSDVFAGVRDGASIDHREGSDAMKGLAVTAVQKIKDEVKAKAGAAGGTAVVPVAAVDVIAAKANAYMGEVFTGKLKLTENAAVSAKTDASHTISADASASGKGAGVGGAFGVSVISDKAMAKLNQSVDAGQVTVATENISNVANTATASASGGKTGGKSADQQADGLIGGASKMAGKNKSSGVSGNSIDNMTKNRQQAQTAEGSVAVAGAVVVNVQNSTSRAEIPDGVDVKASGLLAVTALNGTTSKVKANAGTTNSNIGVGVGVAVNVVGLENIAKMGNGEFEAAMLRVAATTKENEPAKKETKTDDEPKEKDEAVSELTEMVRGYMTDLSKEIGLDQYVPEDMLANIVGPIVDNVTKELLTATGLDKLFGNGGISAKFEKMKDLLSEKGSALVELPEKLIEPMMETLEDALDLTGLTGEQYDALEKALLEEVKAKLQDNLLSWDTFKDMGERLKNAALKWFVDDGSKVLSGWINGKVKTGDKNTVKEVSKEVSKYILGEALGTVKDATLKSFEQALQNVEVPGVTLLSCSRAVKAFKELKDTWKSGEVSRLYEDAADYVKETFKDQVFDYEEVITTLTKTNWVEKISTALRNAAKEVSVTLSNEAVSWLTSTLGVVMEAEQEKATGHVVDTQAISGAGTKNVGIAGSVAITVLNADTSATIADGGKLEVSGEMTVDANELRSVKNVASAALDAKGNAKDNKASEDKDNKNVGGGNDATSVAKNDKNTTNLSVGVGGTASIIEGEKGQDRPEVHITLMEGYKMPEGDMVKYTYTNKEGKEVSGTVKATKKGSEWIVDTKSGALKDVDKSILISFEVKPEEVLHKVKAPDTNMTDLKKLEEGAVTVSVKDRKVNDDNTIFARAGEVVEIKIAKKAGRVLNALGYSYKDAAGKTHEVELNPSAASTGKDKEFTMVSSNEKEIIYTFTMPDADVDDILVSLVEGQEEAQQPAQQEAATAAKDKNGASVGVGAAFSMVYGDTQTHAEVGKRSGTVTAGAMNVNATSNHMENISAAAGTDPMSGDLNTDDSKNFSLDASVALNILDTDVKARNQAEATDVKGYADGEEQKSGDLSVTAKEEASTETTSSAFAVGGQTAVGASVALNIAKSGVKAEMLGDAKVDGSATVSSNSHSEDVTKALATAMGADMARVAGKIGDAAESLEQKSNKVLDGSYLDKAEDKKDNNTANKVNDRLNEKNTDGKGKQAKGGQSVSSNALRSQAVETQNGEEGSSETGSAMSEVSSQAGSTLGVNKKQEKTKVEVAAAVGITIASHEASTAVGKIVANKKIETTSENTGNFNTMGTGAAMSLAEKSNAIAMGVAISVNSNKAGVAVSGDLVSNDKEDVAVTSKLTQNMDGDFQGKLAAQSLAGSVAGKGGGASIAGAVSVVVSKGKSTVDIANGTASANRSIKGGNVTVEATDKSKITARAGGLSLSTGASMGMGIGSTNIITGNNVSAKVGDYTTVEADSFKLNAEKQEVTAKDFKNLIDMRYLITDSSQLTDEQRENSRTGLIDFHKGGDEKNYKVEVNLDSEKLLDAVDGLNFLSGQNTYAEAIAGSISGGAASSLAGSFAVVVTNNDVKASMGKNAKVTTAKGDVDINAKDGNTTRIIAGSLSAAPATNSTGATVAVLVNSDTVDTEVGKDAEFKAAGDIHQNAEATGDQQVFTAAMSLAAGANKHQDSDKEKEEGGSGQSTDTGASVGGAINVIVSKIHANNVLGDNARLIAGGSADITSAAKFDLMAISGSAAVAAGGGVAAGGTVNVIVDSTGARTNIGDGAAIEADKNLTIGSDVSDQLISGTASLSAAASSGMTDGNSGAGVVNVIVSHSKANTNVGKADLTAANGDMKVNANNDAWMLNASMAVAGAKNFAVGASFNVNVFGREATVDLNSGSMNAGGNMAVQTSGRDTGIMAGLTVVANNSTNGDAAVNGNIGVVVESNKINTKIADGVKAVAGKNAIFESYFSDYTVGAAGSITGSGGGSSLSGTVVTVVKNNDVRTELGMSTVEGRNNGESATSLSNKKVEGVYVGANAKETQYIGAAGMSAAEGSAINGEVVTLVNNNKVITDASAAVLNSERLHTTETVWEIPDMNRQLVKEEYKRMRWYANTITVADYLKMTDFTNIRVFYYDNTGARHYINSRDDLLEPRTINVDKNGGSINVESNDDTKQMLLAGGISLSSGAGVGAAVVTVVSGKTVEAKAHDMTAYDDIKVTADNKDKLAQLALSVGVSGSNAVQIGAAIQVLKSKAKATVGSTVESANGNFSLNANNTTDLTNAAAALAVGSGAAVTPVGVVTYFQGETEGKVLSGTRVTVKNVSINTNSNKEISQYAAGFAASSNLGLSGTVSVLVSKDKNSAIVENGATVTANGEDGNVNVKADSDYKLRAASAAMALSGGPSVGVNAMVSVIKSSTIAEIAGKATAKKAVNVNAQGKRDIINAAAALSAGTVGAGVTVMVLSAGAPMSQDAADMVAYGNGDSKSKKTGFDGKTFMSTADSNNRGASEYYGDVLDGDTLDQDLAGNGHNESQQNVGSKDSKGKNTFDASSAYRSEDFDKQDYGDGKQKGNDNEQGRGENLKTSVMYAQVMVDKNGKITGDPEQAVQTLEFETDDPSQATVMFDKNNKVTTDKSKSVRTQTIKVDPSATRIVDLSDTKDVRNAKDVNSYSYEAPTDAVIARIDDTAEVEADQVNVTASQPAAVDMIGATIAGGQTGIGVSTAVAILHSNVSASSTGTIKNAKGSVNIQASSVAGTREKDDEKSKRDAGVKSLLKNALDPSNRAIRVVGVAVGVGEVGVAVSAAVALTDNTTQAILGGRVSDAGNINVHANHDYGNVLAATGSLAGGAFAAGASVAVAQANGTVKALISGNTTKNKTASNAYDIDTTGDVSVTTHSIVEADALAASIGVGATAINAGVGLALNRLRQETGVTDGVKLKATGDLTVTGTIEKAASRSYLLGVSVGAAGLNLNAAVSNVSADVDTHIGRSKLVTAKDTDPTMPQVTKVVANNINIKNTINTESTPKVLSIAGGGLAAGGNLLLAFNETDAQASVENADLSVKNLNVVGNLKGTAQSSLTAAVVGAVAAGISVNYADMRAANRATVMDSTVRTTEATKILTNEHEEATSAEAHSVSTELGDVTVGVNAAVARNNTKNYATLIGDKTLDLNSLTMDAKGNSTAKSELEGNTLSIAKVAASFVTAINDADARVTAVVGNSSRTTDADGNEKATIVPNVLKAKEGLTFNATQNGGTDVKLTTGGGSLVGMALSMALAYGRTNSLVDVSISGGGDYAFVKSDNKAGDAVKSKIANAAVSAVTANALYGAAYSQDVYRTGIQLTGGDYHIRGNVDVTMDYGVNGTADVQPSSSGVDVSLGSLSANAAVANNTAFAGTDFEMSIGKSHVDGNVNVKTQGLAKTDAKVQTAELTVGGLNFTANIAKSNLGMTQAAVLRAGGDLTIDGNVDVQSTVKKITHQEAVAMKRETIKSWLVDVDGEYLVTKKGNTTVMLKKDSDVDKMSASEVEYMYKVFDGDPIDETGSATATASIGAVGGAEGVSFNLGSMDVSKATARENMSNTAAILGAASDVEDTTIPVVTYEWNEKKKWDYDYDEVESVTYKFDKGSFRFETTANEGDFVARTRLLAELWQHTVQEQGGKLSNAKAKLREYFQDNAYADKVYKVMETFWKNVDKGISWNWVKNPLTGKNERYFVKGKYDFPQKALEKAFDKADELGVWDSFSDKSWKEDFNYPWREITYWELEEKTDYIPGLAPVYDTDANHLSVGGDMNVLSGVQNGSKTQSNASAAQSKTVGLLTASKMDINARSTDSFSAMLEGMHATVTGSASIKAASDTNAEAIGTKAGGIAGFDAGKIDLKSGVGRGDDYQTVNVVIGEGATLTAKDIALTSNNIGAAKAGMKADTVLAAAGIKSSSQPTESWYSTGVYIGPKAKLTATNGKLEITSEDMPSAESVANSSSIGIAMNFDTMKGKNSLRQTNRIDIGKDAVLKSSSNLSLHAYQHTNARAETSASGGGFLQGSTVKAENTIDRADIITIADGVNIESTGSNVFIIARAGRAGASENELRDNIYTRAYSDGEGGFAVAKAQAYADIISNTNILLGQGVTTTAKGQLKMDAVFNPYGDRKNYGTDKEGEENYGWEPGIETIAIADSAALIGVPKTTAKTTVNATEYIGINRGGETATTLKAEKIWINASTDRTTLKSQARSFGKGAVGVASSTAWIIANLNNMVWIDNAALECSPWSKINVHADNGGTGTRTHLIGDSYSGLNAVMGKVAPSTLVTGLTINQIRTNDKEKVLWNGSSDKKADRSWVEQMANALNVSGIVHEASKPKAQLWADLIANYKRWQKKVLGITITLTKANVTKRYEWIDTANCDFCGKGTAVDVQPYDDDTTMEKRYKDAYERAMAPINAIYAMASGLPRDPNALMALQLAKGLMPLTYMNAVVKTQAAVMRAHFGEEEQASMSDRFVLAVRSILNKDVRIDSLKLDDYRVWTNDRTFDDVYLLPNATRLFINGGVPQYIAETLMSDLRGNGAMSDIAAITALTEYAYAHPTIPIGSSGSLNMSTGMLTMPSYVDQELYLREVSAGWVVEQIGNDFIQIYVAEPSAANETAINGAKLPQGIILNGIVPNGVLSGWNLYWVGDTPVTVQDPDQALFFLLVDEATDEVDAFRTSANMIANNDMPIDVSLYLFRDSQSDRAEVEKYNLLFFDTPEGKESVVKVVADVLDNRTLEMPKPMRIALRKLTFSGAELPAFSLGGSYIVMLDGTKGTASLFDGLYQNTFDGDVFESDYVLIDGIASGDVNVTLKQNQPVWPEWTGENDAVTVGGDSFIRVDGQWRTEAEAPVAPAPTPYGAKAA